MLATSAMRLMLSEAQLMSMVEDWYDKNDTVVPTMHNNPEDVERALTSAFRDLEDEEIRGMVSAFCSALAHAGVVVTVTDIKDEN